MRENPKRLSTLSRGQRSADVYVNDRGFYPVAFRECAYSMPTVRTFWDRSSADRAVDRWLAGASNVFEFPVGGPADLDWAIAKAGAQ